MRAIFIALVLGNLALLGYGLFLSPGVEQLPSASPTQFSAVPALQLLRETNAGSQGSAPSDRPEPEPALSRNALAEVVDLGESPLCTLVGPLEARERAEALVQRLRSLEVAAEVRDVEVSDGAGYWVYLAPELSHRAALRRLHELQAKQIDSYIIPRGELANGISFGMFSRQELAEARRAEMLARGYEAQIREIERTHREMWVLLPPGEARKVGESLWEQLLESAPDLERRQNFCPGVASD